MRQPKFSILRQISSYLVKGFVLTVIAILLLGVLFGIFDQAEFALTLFTATFPWLVRTLIFIGCALAVTSLAESL